MVEGERELRDRRRSTNLSSEQKNSDLVARARRLSAASPARRRSATLDVSSLREEEENGEQHENNTNNLSIMAATIEQSIAVLQNTLSIAKSGTEGDQKKVSLSQAWKAARIADEVQMQCKALQGTLQTDWRNSQKKASSRRILRSEYRMLAMQLDEEKTTADDLDKIIVGEEEEKEERPVEQSRKLTKISTVEGRYVESVSSRLKKDRNEIGEWVSRQPRSVRVLLASVAIRNALSGDKFRLRYAQPWKIKAYIWYTSKIWSWVMLLMCVAHLLLARIEPPSFRQMNFSNSIARSDYLQRLKVALGIEAALYFIFIADYTMLFLTTGTGSFRRRIVIIRSVAFSACLVDFCVSCIASSCECFVWLRFSRVLRPVLLLTWVRPLRLSLEPLWRSMVKILKVFVVALTAILIFAIIGMQIFGDAHDNSTYIRLHDPAFEDYGDECYFRFTQIFQAFLSLYVLTTSENYPCIMIPAIRGTNTTSLESLKDTSRAFNAIYFIIFYILATFILMNFIIAVVYESYKKHHKTIVIRKHVKERRALLNAFNMIAAKKKGKEGEEARVMDLPTWLELVPHLRRSMSKAKARVLFEEIDEDGSGEIDSLEFLGLSDVILLRVEEYKKKTKRKSPARCPSCRRRLIRLVESRYFQMSIIGLIAVNMILMCVYCSTCSWYDDTTKFILIIIDAILNCLYVVELGLKLLAYGCSDFWKKLWNRFDFIIVTLGVCGVLVDFVLTSDPSNTGALINTLSVVRSLRLISAFSRSARFLRLFTLQGNRSSKMLLTVLFQAIPTISSMMGDMMLILYIYSIVGLELFNSSYRIPYPRDVHDFMSFENWSDSLLLLFQMLSGSNWHELMMYGVLGYERDGKDEMMLITAFYFVSFNFFASFVLLSLILSVVIETVTIMSDMMKEEQQSHHTKGNEESLQVQEDKAEEENALDGVNEITPTSKSHKGLIRTLGLLASGQKAARGGREQRKDGNNFRLRSDETLRRRQARLVEMKSSNIDERILEMEELKVLSEEAGVDLRKLKERRENSTNNGNTARVPSTSDHV
uniref:EF-hand domain-containing protein n=1 Tax=Palpitomonas bilix TaxID=652834 RepID=A0A7S3G9W4_9EUKA|mmetsp:Transcript_39230/g.100529  ORF Transcript_39230/g.100529 Transcript_39230/m.100529 type:complete len:1047 (+) Transcript_39230:300-3440(+)